MALGLVTIGTLLVFVECNRPGKVLPGACGVLLLLSGLHRLSAVSGWTDAAVWLGVTGMVLIGTLRWRLLVGVPGVLGTGLLTVAFALLAKNSGGALGSLPASSCGLLLGSVSSWLMVIAGRAWRAKTGQDAASAERVRTGAAEWWGVD